MPGYLLDNNHLSAAIGRARQFVNALPNFIGLVIDLERVFLCCVNSRQASVDRG